RAGKVDAVAARPARVRVDDGDARVGEGEHLEPRRGAVGDMRAAVDLGDEPPPLAAARRDVPSLDLVPVGVRHGEALRVSPPAAEPAAPVSGEAAQAALLDRADLARPAMVGRDGGDPPAADRERGADDVALDQPLHRPVEPEAGEVAAAAVADRRDDPLAVEPEHARLARRRVVEVARREEGDRPVEVSREPAEALALDRKSIRLNSSHRTISY